MAAAIAAIGGGLISGAGSFFGGKSASKAQARALEAQLAFERKKFEEAKRQREEDISRSFAGREAGFQSDLLNFLEQANALTPTGQAGLETQAAIDELDPSFAGAIDALNTGVFGEGFLGRQTADQLAVNQALQDAAAGEVQAIDETTEEALADLNARAARRGFTGSSSFDRTALARERSRVDQELFVLQQQQLEPTVQIPLVSLLSFEIVDPLIMLLLNLPWYRLLLS